MGRLNLLNEIGLRHGTDKSTIYHDYLPFYEARLQHLRQERFLLVEIGVFHGASLRTWGEYFPNATIVGLDVLEGCRCHEAGNQHVRIGDASQAEFVESVVAEFGRPLVVIDDGSHLWNQQIGALQLFWPTVLPGGHFLMEDIHTSFPEHADAYHGGSAVSAYDYIQELNAWVVGHDYMAGRTPRDAFVAAHWPEVWSIEWHRHTCLINKRAE